MRLQDKPIPELNDKELVERAAADQTNAAYVVAITRHNIEAINRFNKASTVLSIAMIALTIIIFLFTYTENNKKQISTINKNTSADNIHTGSQKVKPSS